MFGFSRRGVSRTTEPVRNWIRERQIGFRLEKFGKWVAGGSSYWGPIVGIVGAFAVGWGAKVLNPSEFALSDQFRITGWLLQILGVSTVAVGLKKTRAIFGVPPVTAQFVEWLRRFPKALERRKTITGSMSLQDAPETITATGTLGPNPDASIEERLEALEEKYKQLNRQLAKARNEVTSEVRRLDSTIKEERNIRNEADAKIREQLESFSVGGLHLESIGMIWLLAGITFATLPGEIAAIWGLL